MCLRWYRVQLSCTNIAGNSGKLDTDYTQCLDAHMSQGRGHLNTISGANTAGSVHKHPLVPRIIPSSIAWLQLQPPALALQPPLLPLSI